METLQRYMVNKPNVVAEVIDGELVAIQLETGCYYHANPTGSFIWTALEQGRNVAAVVESFASQWGIDADQAQREVTAFVDTLVQETLIRENQDVQLPAVASGIEVTVASEYTVPTLKRHEDMKELLLLDPIHDIGQKPWPTHVV